MAPILRIPAATYRLQLQSGCRFADAAAVAAYLQRLGISDLYASPLFQARPGSAHGYDVTDPARPNPGLGTAAQFQALVRELRKRDMGLLLDIVPNHMAASPENRWWSDVLENGAYSPYAGFFDIDWAAAGGKIVLPVLGKPLGRAWRAGEFSLAGNASGLFIRFHGHKLPLNLKSYPLVFSLRQDRPAELTGALAFLDSPDKDNGRQEYEMRQSAKKEFLHLVRTVPGIKTLLRKNVASINRDEARFKDLLREQHYQLVHWKTGREKLNYRRFFDISDLVGMRVEEPRVFHETHALVLRLIREGKVTGLRIDHIDGLRDPQGYLERLQREIAPERGGKPGLYVVVEKILSGDEQLPEAWPVSGTTGYDFARAVNALFVDREGATALAEIYARFRRSDVKFGDVVYEKKKQVIRELFPGEIAGFAQRLTRLATVKKSKVGAVALVEVLAEVTACLPVYRTYVRTSAVSPRDRRYLGEACREAERRNRGMAPAAFEMVRRVLLLDFPEDLPSEQKKAWRDFIMRWQQWTGAVMAKGVEDTAFYNYYPLLSLDEVGSDPAAAVPDAAAFHRFILSRRQRFPHTLNATATHDTKRSEDIRARLNVLSGMPQEWEKRLERWQRWLPPRNIFKDGTPVPDPNMTYFLFQTMVGAWPLFEEEVPEFRERLGAYLIKAAREARTFTDWLSPDRQYEEALLEFVDTVLGSGRFFGDFRDFQGKVAFYGAVNSLAQVLLKITLPGVPDFYQGTELWDFSLVDPDNRRPVDFRKRVEFLDRTIAGEEKSPAALVAELLSCWRDGRVKQYLIYRALDFRRNNAALFQEGVYLPLNVSGEKEKHVLAFARRRAGVWALVVVPRLLTGLVAPGVFPVGKGAWGEDRLPLPEGAPGEWHHHLTGERFVTRKMAWLSPEYYGFSPRPFCRVRRRNGTVNDTGGCRRAYPVIQYLVGNRI